MRFVTGAVISLLALLGGCSEKTAQDNRLQNVLLDHGATRATAAAAAPADVDDHPPAASPPAAAAVAANP